MPTRYIVDDPAASLAFYRDVLGFELVEQWGPHFAIVRRDDVTLWLSGPATSAAKPMPDGSVPKSGGWNRIVLSSSAFDEEYARLVSAGVHFRNEPITGPGGSQVLFDDPSGNPIELFQPRD